MIDDMLAIDDHCYLGESGPSHGLGCFSADDCVARRDRHGIDRSVVCHFITPLVEADAFPRGNDFILRAVAEYPHRLLAVCVVNPRYGKLATQEAQRCLAEGMRGLKLHPVLHGFYSVNSPLVTSLMKLAAEAGVPVIIHSDFNEKCCSPSEIARLAGRFPQVPVIMLHMGIDPEGLAYLPEIVEPVSNLYMDTSPTPDLPKAVYVNTVRRLGADRVLFGSDGPLVSVETNLVKLAVAEHTYGLTKDEKRQVLGANAARLFRPDSRAP